LAHKNPASTKKRSEGSSQGLARPKIRVRAKVESRQGTHGVSNRIRLFVGNECKHVVSSRKLKGYTPEQVDLMARELVKMYENTYGADEDHEPERLDADTSADRAAAGGDRCEFEFDQAKARFLDMIQAELSAARRAHYEVYFRDTVIPFFIEERECSDPREWPPLFDLFKGWLWHRRRRDGRTGTISLTTANCRDYTTT